MRTDNNNLLASISSDHMNQMVKEVKETVATGINGSDKQVFSAAELWRIQNTRRMRVQRRSIFNF